VPSRTHGSEGGSPPQGGGPTRQNAAATWKKTFGYHPLLVFLDRPDIAGGEALAGLLRPGNAGSNTAADHITVLGWALDSLPADRHPDPNDPGAQKILVRSDSAGATHRFAAQCRAKGAGFSFGFAVDIRVRDAAETLNKNKAWYPAIDSGGGIREGAWIVEVERREALFNRVEVEDLHHAAVAAAG